jgi:zinc protease
MLNESTMKHTAEEINEKLDMLGSSVAFSSSRDELSLSVMSLTKNLDATLAIAEEMLSSPKFDQKEFDTDKKQTLESIANNVTQPTIIADNVYDKLIYGENNILSIPNIGTEKSVESITLEDVKKYYTDHYSPSIAEVVIVGDVDQQSSLKKIKFLEEWKMKPVALRPSVPNRPNDTKTKIYLVNKDKAAQSVVKMGEVTGMKFDATGEYFKASVMNYSLGGAFNSRINMDLREKKGFTYGAHSVFNSDKYTGVFTVSAPVRTNASDSTVMDIVHILKDLNENGITPAEIDFTKKSMTQSDALKYETPRQKAGFLKRILDYNLDKNYVKQQTEVLNGLSKADLDALVKKYIVTDNMLILVVGDKKVIYPGLAKLGYEIIELDTNGNMLAPNVAEEKKEEHKESKGQGPAGVPDPRHK